MRLATVMLCFPLGTVIAQPHPPLWESDGLEGSTGYDLRSYCGEVYVRSDSGVDASSLPSGNDLHQWNLTGVCWRTCPHGILHDIGPVGYGVTLGLDSAPYYIIDLECEEYVHSSLFFLAVAALNSNEFAKFSEVPGNACWLQITPQHSLKGADGPSVSMKPIPVSRSGS